MDNTTPHPQPKTHKPDKRRVGQKGRSPAMLAKLRELGVREDFPLFPVNGQWAKKIRGRLVYFGSDPQAAEALWQEQKDDLEAGRTPRPAGTANLTVKDLCNRFLTFKRQALTEGELSSRSFQDYYGTCLRFAEAVGGHRAADDLRDDDFMGYRSQCATRLGPTALGNEIQRVRTLCKYAFDADLVEKPIKCGPSFKKPKPKTRRLLRAERPAKFLSRGEIRLLLASPKCSKAMRAMILLAVNTGYGNTDVSELQRRHLDLDAAIADFPRPKTGIGRRAVLWPETVAALKAALKIRPKHKRPDDKDCVFITKYGERWKRVECIDAPDGDKLKVQRRETDSVGLLFGRLLRCVKVRTGKRLASIKRPGVNFYALRHVFRTVAGEVGDREAVDRIMGHADEGMGDVYREWEKDDREGNPRLRKIADHVHNWLFGTSAVVVK